MGEETRETETSSGTACDSAGQVASFDLRATKLLGWKPEEMVGKQSLTVFHEPREVATLVPRLLKSAADVGKSEDEVAIVRQDGSEFMDILTVRPLLKRGEGVGRMGMTRHLKNV
jgi:PAS domain S-box-containing protein